MKLRTSFVSNSSSSSYILNKLKMTEFQLELIRDHYNVYKKLTTEEYLSEYDSWNIDENELTIRLYTFMDNLDMGWFLDQIGVPNEAIIECDKDG